MAVLANEIVLTRIFSVTLWYHFAFLVISLALLGSGAAGVWLFLLPQTFGGDSAPRRLPWLALGYALTTLAAFLLYQQIPLTVDGLREGLDTEEGLWLLLVYTTLTIPFIFAGATIALALKHYQAQAGRMYFADLVGASLGCLLSVLLLDQLGGAGAIPAVSLLGLLSALCLSLGHPSNRPRWIIGGLLTLGVVALVAQVNSPWLTLQLSKTYNNDEPILEEWNAFSRITLYEDDWAIPFGWGISQTYFRQPDVRDPGHYMILIDEKAGTPIQRHNWNNGQEDWATVDFLRYDVTALPYYLRPGADVFIVGPGGGRDVLTALLFEADQIVGVEVNSIIVDLVKHQYPDYAGHIYSRPNVEIQVDDARTYLAAHDAEFDIIQASLIDTFAASSAGAFALSENGIYTVEAFEEYYDHLKPDGMVNFSRWYYAEGPAETLRMVSVGLQAWENQGISDPSQHIIVLANLTPDRIVDEGLAGMLLKKSPFTPAEIETIWAQAEALEFAVLYAPGVIDPSSSPVAEFVLSQDRQAFIDSYPLDISPATDNRPFFFNVVRFSDLGQDEFSKSAIYGFGAEATRILIVTLGITILLALLLIILPLGLGYGQALRSQGGGVFIGYYAMLGLGFILVEIPMLQKLNLYLGNPTYALVLVLFSLLLFSGIGAYFTQQVKRESMLTMIRYGIAALLVLVLLYAFALPSLLRATQGLPLEGRALLVVVMLMPAGLLMGRPFPLGLRYVEAIGAGQLMPWLWAANGTLSVVGSVSATILAIQVGFNGAFVVGVAAYAIAWLLTWRFAPLQATNVS
jgi:SAM-dependent methyltransferase